MSAPTITMRDLARSLGLSLATVSYALRGDRRVSETTRSRVLGAAREQNYRPNPQVAALMSQVRTSRVISGAETIAYISGFTSEAEWRDTYPQRRIFRGAVERARSLGFNLELFSPRAHRVSEARLRHTLQARGIRGVLFGPSRMGEDTQLFEDWSSFAMVTIGYTLGAPRLHRVASDNFNNLLLAVEKLRGAGFRRIGCVLPDELSRRNNDSWFAGWETARRREPDLCGLPSLMLSSVQWRAEVVLAWYETYRPDVLLCNEVGPAAWLRDALGSLAPPWVSLSTKERLAAFGGIRERQQHKGATAVAIVAEQLRLNVYGIPEYPILSLVAGAWEEASVATGLLPADDVNEFKGVGLGA